MRALPAWAAGEQEARVVGVGLVDDRHDDGRVGAREVMRTVRFAATHPARLDDDGGRPAARAVRVRRMPLGQRDGRGDAGEVVARQFEPDVAQGAPRRRVVAVILRSRGGSRVARALPRRRRDRCVVLRAKHGERGAVGRLTEVEDDTAGVEPLPILGLWCAPEQLGAPLRHRGAAHVEDPRRRDGEQPLDEIRFGAPQRITVDDGVAEDEIGQRSRGVGHASQARRHLRHTVWG